MGIFDHMFDDGYGEKLTEGEDYMMSKDGYRIMTESYLVRRGYCCSNGCTNCPYFPRAQKGNRQLRPELGKKYR